MKRLWRPRSYTGGKSWDGLRTCCPTGRRIIFRGAALVAQDKNLLGLARTWHLVEKTTPEPPASGQEVNLDEVWGKTRVNFEHWAELAQLDLLVVMGGFGPSKATG